MTKNNTRMEAKKKMNGKKGKVLLASAAAGLMTLAVTAASVGEAKAEAAKGDAVKCYGVNKCKGTGECGGKGHGCAGKNECAGNGWVMKPKDECLAMAGGRLTAEPEGAPAPAPEKH
jgi:uncharacterized membrane protein